MPANNNKVKFVYGTRAQYNAVSPKSNDTFYVVVETNGDKKLYLGADPLGSADGFLKLDGTSVMTGPLQMTSAAEMTYDETSKAIKFVFK